MEKRKGVMFGVVTQTPKEWVFKPTRQNETQVILLRLKFLTVYIAVNKKPSIKLSRHANAQTDPQPVQPPGLQCTANEIIKATTPQCLQFKLWESFCFN